MKRSFLDNDLYKFTMQQAMLDHFEYIQGEGAFTDRGNTQHSQQFIALLQNKIEAMADVRLTDQEALWLQRRCPYLSHHYISYLKDYRYDPDQVKFYLNRSGRLVLNTKGLWSSFTMWEIPLLYLISETYYELEDTNWTPACQSGIALDKISRLSGVTFADFGTRRRRNYGTQDTFVRNAVDMPGFSGTSNVHLAHKYDCRPIGTMAHEWIMGVSAIDGLQRANYYAFHRWAQTYKGDLGIALPDTFGMNAFYNDFDSELARLFDGVRWDSGDWRIFGDRLIAHYRQLRIDPMHKSGVFTNDLNVDSALEIARYFEGRINTSFGIGTHFTNDFANSKALRIVLKLTHCNGIPVVKLSEDRGKETGDSDALRVARWTFHKTPLHAVGL